VKKERKKEKSLFAFQISRMRYIGVYAVFFMYMECDLYFQICAIK
jgi:hypothetical protein